MIRRAVPLALAALLGGALIATAVAPADAAPGAKAAQARKVAPVGMTAPRDWTRTVVVTPEGGYRMGNPAAPVKLIEYASLTCPHCAHFSESAKAPLAARVRSGKVSFEFRNFVLNGIDVTATLLARCASPSRFFPLTETLYATQKQWVGRISGMPAAEKEQLRQMPEPQRLTRLAEIGGLTQIAAQSGVTPQQVKACLADPAGLKRLEQIAEAGAALGVRGTPTFFINGERVDGDEWAAIAPHIARAGG